MNGGFSQKIFPSGSSKTAPDENKIPAKIQFA